ncbi:VanZ family protein [uncultured Bacteroides sp.]|uniref:VanZ family protein n=1 Tax=uncultured Bacteroides sp. TaxID=162156 RepID=UPI002AA93D9F|nr:VanZ family protein [uncultured Bacteroides sp.]
MISKIRKYPFSIAIILAVIYLSFFKPPKTPLDQVHNIDKLVHLCMYFGLSGMLWLEYMRSHRSQFRIKHIFIGAVVCPIIFSGCIELLQQYCTSYRGGDWLDLAANSVGVTLAGITAYFFIKPKFF